MEYYACRLTVDEIKKWAKTEKVINSSLDDLSELDEEEYTNLLSWCLYESCATNFPYRFTGICYTMLIYERDPGRFRRNFTDAFRKSYPDVSNREYFYDDFYDLYALLEIIDTDVCRQFMELSSASEYEEIRESACEWLKAPPKVDTESPYYRSQKAEYAEFTRKL